MQITHTYVSGNRGQTTRREHLKSEGPSLNVFGNASTQWPILTHALRGVYSVSHTTCQGGARCTHPNCPFRISSPEFACLCQSTIAQDAVLLCVGYSCDLKDMDALNNSLDRCPSQTSSDTRKSRHPSALDSEIRISTSFLN